MKVHFGIDDFSANSQVVTTIGTFDGVHQGHKSVLKQLVETASKEKLQSVLLTFYPHPRLVLYPDNNDLRMINTQDEKIELLDQTGIDHLIVHPFTREFSRLSSVEFVRDILVSQLNTKILISGYDHHFGRNREGSFEELSELSELYEFEVRRLKALEVSEVNVSSTKIRKALEEGAIEMANEYLGYPFRLSGTIVKGDQIGRKIGFPTANVRIQDHHKLIPGFGAYAVKILLEKESLNGMLNIGARPTVSKHLITTIEVHIFDFDREIYGQEITLELIGRLRDEKKFEDLEDLKKQLEIDKNKSINLL